MVVVTLYSHQNWRQKFCRFFLLFLWTCLFLSGLIFLPKYKEETTMAKKMTAEGILAANGFKAAAETALGTVYNRVWEQEDEVLW